MILKELLNNLTTEELELVIDIRYEKDSSQEELDILESEYEKRSDISLEDLGENEEIDLGLSLEENLADNYKLHFINKFGTLLGITDGSESELS